MPAKPLVPETVYIVSQFSLQDCDVEDGLRQPEGYSTAAAAKAAAEDLMNRTAKGHEFVVNHGEGKDSLYEGTLVHGQDGEFVSSVKVWKVEVKSGKRPTKAKQTVVSRPKARKSQDGAEGVDGQGDDDDDDDDDEVDDAKAAGKSKTKKPGAAGSASSITAGRSKIPDGKPGCLKGLKLLFTGTFDTMDRKTSVATAEKYGAEVIKKLDETDYIILGTKAGPKKLEEINEKELETLTEAEFFDLLENGISKEKRARMAARRAADEQEGPAKKKVKK